MTMEDTIKQMSTPEKLRVMELLWESLEADRDLPAPAWHAEILDKRSAADAGAYVDWNQAKKDL